MIWGTKKDGGQSCRKGWVIRLRTNGENLCRNDPEK